MARLREPSTWAALGTLAVLAGHPLPEHLGDAGPALAALACALLGITMREGGPPAA